MSAYAIANFNVLNEDKLKQYGAAAAATIGQYGGEYIAKGKAVSLHGEANHSMMVVIKFKNLETATNWYQSEEYQQLIPVRNEAMDSEFRLVG